MALFHPGSDDTELLESWINGNKSHVIEQLGKMHPLQAALMAAYLYDRMESYDQGVFGRMLQAKAPGKYPRRYGK